MFVLTFSLIVHSECFVYFVCLLYSRFRHLMHHAQYRVRTAQSRCSTFVDHLTFLEHSRYECVSRPISSTCERVQILIEICFVDASKNGSISIGEQEVHSFLVTQEKMRDIGEDYPSVLQFAHLDVFPIELCNEHRYFVVCFRKGIPKRKHR